MRGDTAAPTAWGFRVASRPQVGHGHMSRCLALAQEMTNPVCFFLDPASPWSSNLDALGFESVEECDSQSSAAILSAVESGKLGGVLFDGLDLDGRDISKAADRAFTAAFVGADDPADSIVWIDPTFGSDAGPNTIAGPAYAPLAPTYAAARDRAKRPVAEHVERLLIAFGAYDSADLTGRTLDALATLECAPRVTVALGAAAPHRERVASRIAEMANSEIVISAEDMIPYYEASDIAIGAPGVSFLERLCCGLPSLLLCQNQAQQPIARAAAKQGAAELASEDDLGALARHIEELLADAGRRTALRRRGLESVDGRGAKRLARELESRRAEFDAALVADVAIRKSSS